VYHHAVSSSSLSACPVQSPAQVPVLASGRRCERCPRLLLVGPYLVCDANLLH
jgi:hypothetical protein